jgi:hypothetical protein
MLESSYSQVPESQLMCLSALELECVNSMFALSLVSTLVAVEFIARPPHQNGVDYASLRTHLKRICAQRTMQQQAHLRAATCIARARRQWLLAF